MHSTSDPAQVRMDHLAADRREATVDQLANALTEEIARLREQLDRTNTERQRLAEELAEVRAERDHAQARNRPRVVCLCGSTRFYDAFQRANYDLTMAGAIVLSVGFYPHAKAEHGHGEGVGHDSTEKLALDELHKRKIDLADEVLVLNVGGYIGSSTRSEIEYAQAHGKPVRYLETVDRNACPAAAPTLGEDGR